MSFPDADNTLAMGDHADHIHVGWRPRFGANRKAARAVASVLSPASGGGSSAGSARSAIRRCA